MSVRLFSGIQPSGDIHIGNYLGAIRNWVDLIPRFECIYCVVDLHAITVPYEPADMQQRILEAAAVNIACGIDPERCTLFVQSYVPEHTELAWLLNTITPIGDLQRMTQFKDKAKQLEEKKMDAGASKTGHPPAGAGGREGMDAGASKTGHPPAGAGGRESISAGLLNYPVLMAADILLYKAEVVPVGEDQVQHLELSREVTRRFNSRYGPLFPEPKERLTAAARVMGLDDPTRKMSKSLGNTIGLLEDPKSIWEKIRTGVTDPARVRRTDPGEPTKCNLYSLHQFFSSPEPIDYVAQGCRSAGIGCIECKKILFESMMSVLNPIRERATQLLAEPQTVWSILRRGADRCREIATATMAEVRKAMGLLPPR